MKWQHEYIKKVILAAKQNRAFLSFREHFRDYMIGVECEENATNLISDNKNHFKWVKKISVKTHQEFLSQFI